MERPKRKNRPKTWAEFEAHLASPEYRAQDAARTAEREATDREHWAGVCVKALTILMRMEARMRELGLDANTQTMCRNAALHAIQETAGMEGAGVYSAMKWAIPTFRQTTEEARETTEKA